ncbi:MAG: hypothetical protein LUG56_03705, partial [Lachnospiraceae bacterium]|nr:hypothetical protein [Lachnospiraceae bacterium]
CKKGTSLDDLYKKIKSLRCDQTTDSMIKLVAMVKKYCIRNIKGIVQQDYEHLKKELGKEKEDEYIHLKPFDFWKNVKFELINIDEVSDAEQLFMDLNSGLKLEDYETYKARLMDRLSKVGNKRDIMRSIDNGWLNKFNSEKFEMTFFRDLVKYLYVEVLDDYSIKDFNVNIEEDKLLWFDKFDDARWKLVEQYMRELPIKDIDEIIRNKGYLTND